ncbi:MAG TPA: hypothetical protein DIW43_00295, partial [Spongiibacteraceae bacterium]|nr:hypothetical protein [Spongiibacteraceae bacterium]
MRVPNQPGAGHKSFGKNTPGVIKSVKTQTDKIKPEVNKVTRLKWTVSIPRPVQSCAVELPIIAGIFPYDQRHGIHRRRRSFLIAP